MPDDEVVRTYNGRYNSYSKSYYFKNTFKCFAKHVKEECDGAILKKMKFSTIPTKGPIVFIKYEYQGKIYHRHLPILTTALHSKAHFRLFRTRFYHSQNNIEIASTRDRNDWGEFIEND